MPLLHDDRISDSDQWIQLDDDQEVLSDQADFAIINYHRYLQRAKDDEQLPDGVCVGPTDDVNALAEFVNQLRIICIEFPVFTDGRGYSQARLLRKRLMFTGELRALGDIREDQILFMQRVGINSFNCNSVPDTRLVSQLTSRFEHMYQPSYKPPHVNQ